MCAGVKLVIVRTKFCPIFRTEYGIGVCKNCQNVIIESETVFRIDKLRLPSHGLVSERFRSELLQKAPDLFTQFNKNQHKPRLRTKTKNFMPSEFL